jgi:uncharacterized protein with NRDE domain
MCIITLLFQPPFVTLVHLRDEVLSRLACLPSPGDPITCVCDVPSGGTWCGLNRATGVFCALTNVRAAGLSGGSGGGGGGVSRGALVMGVLRGDGAVTAAAVAAAAASGAPLPLGAPFAPFNMVVGTLAPPLAVFFVSNVAPSAGGGLGAQWAVGGSGGAAGAAAALPPGAHVVCNGPGVSDARWPKVAWCAAELAGCGGGGRWEERLGAAARPLLRTQPLPAPPHLLAPGALAWSPLPPDVELRLITHVVVPRDEGRNYGSRALTAVVGEEGRAAAATFCWSPLPGEAAAGGAGDGSGENTTLAGGVAWRVLA